MQAQDNGGAVFSYSELQVQLSNRPQDEKASRSTVSRALLMLRLTRWLSLCHKAWIGYPGASSGISMPCTMNR